jgi:hypothetical protein
MTRNALIALAGGTAIALAAPLAAQSSEPGAAAGQPAAAQPNTSPAATAPAVAPANSDDPNTQSTDPKADPKAKAKATGGTVVRAGPNAGTVIGGKAKKPKGDVDSTQKADDQPGSDKCTTSPCR